MGLTGRERDALFLRGRQCRRRRQRGRLFAGRQLAHQLFGDALGLALADIAHDHKPGVGANVKPLMKCHQVVARDGLQSIWNARRDLLGHYYALARKELARLSSSNRYLLALFSSAETGWTVKLEAEIRNNLTR